MDFERVKVDVHGAVGVLTLNHPEVMNAVSPEMLKGLTGAMSYIEKPATGLRALIMTGQGRGFCAGANLSGGPSSNEFGPQERDAGAALETIYHPFLRRLRNLKMPFITAVNGAAAGVGMSFALMGDMILAGKSAYFLQAFRRIGLVPGRRLDLATAASGRFGARERTFAARRKTAGREGARMGPDQSRL